VRLLGIVALAAGCSSPTLPLLDLSVPADLAPYPCPSLASFCRASGFALECAPFSAASCGSFTEIVEPGADTGHTFFYDRGTHALVAVLLHDFTGVTSCVGGPASFSAPPCADTPAPLCP